MSINVRLEGSMRAVRDALAASGLTQKTVAEITGIPYTSLNRKLTGRSGITLGELFLLAEAIGVPPSRFVDGSHP